MDRGYAYFINNALLIFPVFLQVFIVYIDNFANMELEIKPPSSHP